MRSLIMLVTLIFALAANNETENTTRNDGELQEENSNIGEQLIIVSTRNEDMVASVTDGEDNPDDDQNEGNY